MKVNVYCDGEQIVEDCQVPEEQRFDVGAMIVVDGDDYIILDSDSRIDIVGVNIVDVLVKKHAA
jgi:hypothetical protein